MKELEINPKKMKVGELVKLDRNHVAMKTNDNKIIVYVNPPKGLRISRAEQK